MGVAEQAVLQPNRTHGSIRVYAILLFCVTCYASTFVFSALLVREFHPVALTLFRLISINAFLIVVGWRYIKKEKIALKLLIILAVAGFIGISLSHWSLHHGLVYTDPITAALIYALGPLLTSLITYFYLKERRRIYFWLGILTSLIGVYFVVSKGSGFALQVGKGELFIGLTILTFSVYLVIVQYLSKYLEPMVITVYTSLFGLLLFFPFVRIEHIQTSLNIDIKLWVLLIVSAIVTNGLCTMLWNGAVRQVGAATSSLFINVEPFAAMIIGYIILHQIVQPIQLIGSIFIIIGVIMGTRLGKKVEKTPNIEQYNT